MRHTRRGHSMRWSGGIITSATGRLVRLEDPEDVAAGIEHVLDHRGEFDPRRLHEDIIARFGTDAIAQRVKMIYAEVLH